MLYRLSEKYPTQFQVAWLHNWSRPTRYPVKTFGNALNSGTRVPARGTGTTGCETGLLCARIVCPNEDNRLKSDVIKPSGSSGHTLRAVQYKMTPGRKIWIVGCIRSCTAIAT